MAFYNVLLKPSVEKDLRSLPKPVIGRVMKQIEALKSNAHPRQASKLASTELLYRIRVGDYRIVYSVDQEAQQILVQYVRHRREVYRQV